MDCKHCDCINYENVDITKGLCLCDGGFVPFDAAGCPRFSAKPRCKSCTHYTPGAEAGLGECNGLSDGSYWISGDMNAAICSGYAKAAEV